ncbi:hypothetical protein [Paraburkholderia ferrariae]|uniref:CopG family transcriptional regulator n=1 Tax=Paraburkholderia ferrariae TaxID=386056 RepID=A0ABU9RNR4_9BURK
MSNNGTGFAKPTIVWASDATRDKLREVCEIRGVSVERFAGRLLDQAVLNYTPSAPDETAKASTVEPDHR